MWVKECDGLNCIENLFGSASTARYIYVQKVLEIDV